MHVVANLMNPREYEAKFMKWWPAPSAETGRCSFNLFHALPWQAAKYAELVADDHTQENYLRELRRAGIKEVGNGLIHIYKRPDFREGGHAFNIRLSHEYLWQVLAGFTPYIKDLLAEMAAGGGPTVEYI